MIYHKAMFSHLMGAMKEHRFYLARSLKWSRAYLNDVGARPVFALKKLKDEAFLLFSEAIAAEKKKDENTSCEKIEIFFDEANRRLSSVFQRQEALKERALRKEAYKSAIIIDRWIRNGEDLDLSRHQQFLESVVADSHLIASLYDYCRAYAFDGVEGFPSKRACLLLDAMHPFLLKEEHLDDPEITLDILHHASVLGVNPLKRYTAQRELLLRRGDVTRN